MMTVNRDCILMLVLVIGCGTYTVLGFECHIAKEPIIITGDTTYSVTFTWDCSLMSNESILSKMWLKDDICIGKVSNDTFTPCESYKGRVEVFDTFGMSLHNISRNDSGHYNVVVLLKDSHHTFLPCHPTYFPVLPEQRSGIREGKALQFAVGENSSTCDQQGASKLEIGLICGFLPLTVITGISVILWYFRRRKHANNSKNGVMSREQIIMIEAPI